ncbi:MAG: hypothetical protein FWD77_07630 [Betaproteobacteria bacterium]|nr:hypothetical protein [Betaproteobacteria bacterium]
MKHPLFHALGHAALAFLFFLAPASGAFAASKTITAAMSVGYDVCGNSDDSTHYADCVDADANAADGNAVTIESGVNSTHDAYGAYSFSIVPVTANSNTLDLYGVVKSAYGAWATSSSGDATASDNTVTLYDTGDATTEIYGGYADSSVGPLFTATASNNTVSITGGTLSTSGIYGGSSSGDASVASNNTVSITGGTVSNLPIYGGYAAGPSSQEASGNTVEIGGTAIIGPGVSLFGGMLGGAGASTISANTLKFHLSGVSVDNLGYFQNLDFFVPKNLGSGETMLTVAYIARIDDATLSVGIESGSALKAGDRIVLIDASSPAALVGALASADVISLTAGYQFSLDPGELANDRIVLKIIAVPSPPSPSGSTPTPIQIPIRTYPIFSDGDTLPPGSAWTAPAGNSSFCLGGSPGSAPVVRMDYVPPYDDHPDPGHAYPDPDIPDPDELGSVGILIGYVPYTINVPHYTETENTCFEIFSEKDVGALILDRGSAYISTIVPGAPLLEARNGDLVTNASNSGNSSVATIRATLDPVCTSTRITVLEGKVDAPDWMTSPMPSTGCPEDALTPKQGSFMVGDGKLACNPSALSIKGTWAKLTVKQSQSVAAGQQLFAVAAHPVYGWFQNNGQGWMPLGDPFLPIGQATQTGSTTSMPVDRLDVRPILGTELYVGNGKDAEEMMRNGRYCGAFRVTP